MFLYDLKRDFGIFDGISPNKVISGNCMILRKQYSIGMQCEKLLQQFYTLFLGKRRKDGTQCEKLLQYYKTFFLEKKDEKMEPDEMEV